MANKVGKAAIVQQGSAIDDQAETEHILRGVMRGMGNRCGSEVIW